MKSLWSMIIVRSRRHVRFYTHLLTVLIVFVNPFDYIQHIASINILLIHPQAGVLCPF